MRDDTALVQNVLLNRGAYLHPGDYYCKTLGVSSNTRFYSDCKEATRIFAHPDLALSDPLLQSYGTTGVHIEGISFMDAKREGRTGPCLSFNGNVDLYLDNIAVYNNPYMGVALGDTTNAQAEYCVFEGNGTGIWVGSMGAGNRGTTISRCAFRNTRATPISVAGSNKDVQTEGTIIDKCPMTNIGENAIYINAWTKDTTVHGCNIDTVRRDDVIGDNGTGVEAQGEGLKFIDNYVRNIDWSCLLLFQPRGATVRGNTFSNPGQNLRHMEPGNDPSACIRVNSLGVHSPWQPPDGPYKAPRKLIFDGNICEDDQHGIHYGIIFQGEDDCLPYDDVTLINNITRGSTWLTPTGLMVKTARINGVVRSVWDAECSATNNIGF